MKSIASAPGVSFCRCPTACIVILLLLAIFTASQAADFKDLLSGKTCPLAVQLGDLGQDWRRFTLHTPGNASGNISVSVTGSGGNSGSSQNNIADLAGSRIYLTKGQTVSANAQVYLVAYRLPGNGLDLASLIQALATKSAPAPATLTAETALPLSLLDVKSLGCMDDIRAFDLKREIAESEKLVKIIETALKSASGAEKQSGGPATQDKPAK